MIFSGASGESPASHAQAIFTLKSTLKSAGWVVRQSSDGTTYNASGDQITTASSGAGGMDNNHAWFVIQQPAGGRQLGIQRSNTTGANWRVKYSFLAGLTGGSPSATVMPTATDEQYIWGSSGAYVQWFAHAAGTYFYYCGVDSSAPYGFWSAAYENAAAGTPGHALVVDPGISSSQLLFDQDPFVFYASSALAFQTNGMNDTQQEPPRAWANYGIGGQAWKPAVALMYTGLSFTIVQIRLVGIWTPNPFNGDRVICPIYFGIADPQIGQHKIIGRHMRWTINSDTSGTRLVLPPGLGGFIDFIVIGKCALPWDGITIPKRNGGALSAAAVTIGFCDEHEVADPIPAAAPITNIGAGTGGLPFVLD